MIGQCPPSLLRVTEQVRNINSSSCSSPLLCTCGPGYELARARPLSTLFANVNTLLFEKEKRENMVQIAKQNKKCFCCFYSVFYVVKINAYLYRWVFF